MSRAKLLVLQRGRQPLRWRAPCSPLSLQHTAAPPRTPHRSHLNRVAFIDGAHAAWQDLEEIYAPAAAEGRLPLRVYAFVPLPLW